MKTVFLVSTQNIGTGTMQKWTAQVGMVVTNVGKELSLLRMAVNTPNADYYFPCCQQWAAGSLELDGGKAEP